MEEHKIRKEGDTRNLIWPEDLTDKLSQYYSVAGWGKNSGIFNLKGVINTLKIQLIPNSNVPHDPACKQILASIQLYDCRFGKNSLEEVAQAYNGLKNNIEPFARIILKRCSKGILKIDDSSIGKINEALLTILKTKCRPSDMELNLLTTSLSKGENFRNAKQHNATDHDAQRVMSIGCETALNYLLAVIAIYRKISMARGGIRFKSDCSCDLNFLQEQRQPVPFAKVEPGKTLQIEGVPGKFRLQVIVTTDDGAQHVFDREGLIEKEQYAEVSFCFTQEMGIVRKDFNISNPLFDDEEDDELSTGIPYHGGIYIGPLNAKGQPHGIGSLRKAGIEFSGRFNHGQPCGSFIVEGVGFEYKGSVRTKGEHWSLCRGTIVRHIRKKSGDQTWCLEGDFRGLFCVEGKLNINGQLIYEGPFTERNGCEVAEGNGTLYLPGGAMYRGEIVRGKPQGRGFWINAEATEARYADWVNGTPLGEVIHVIDISGDCTAFLYDGVIRLCSLSREKSLRLHLYDIQGIMLLVKNQAGHSVDCPIKSGDSFRYELIDYDQLELFPKKGENGKWGYVDKNGKVVISYRYDNAYAFMNGVSQVEQDGKIGLITKKGMFLCPCQFDYVDDFSKILTRVRIKSKWGYIDQTGKQVCPCQFDEAYPIDDMGMAKVQLNRKQGYIDRTGKFVVSCQFDQVWGFSDNLALVEKSGLYGYINRQGQIAIPCQFKLAESFHEGRAYVLCDNKYGYIDVSGKIVIPCLFENAGSFRDGKAKVTYREKEIFIGKDWKEPAFDYGSMRLFPFQGKNKKWGFKNEDGFLMIKCEFDEVDSFSEGLARVKYCDKWGFINKRGNIVIPCQFVNSGIFSEGMAAATLPNKIGYINKIGDVVIPGKYSSGGCFSEGWVNVKFNGKWGFVDKHGKIVLPFVFDNADPFKKGRAKVTYNGNEILISKDWKEPIDYERLELFPKKGKNGKYGYVDKNGKVFIDFQYSDVSSFSEDLANVKHDTKWGFVNKDGKVVIPFVFDYAYPFKNGRANVTYRGQEISISKDWKESIYFDELKLKFKKGKNGKYGYVDEKGNVFIDFQFEEALNFFEGKAQVKQNGNWFRIDKNGRRID